MIDRVSFFNGDAREVTATTERRTADARHAIRNRDACEATATVERRTADARHTFRNRDARETTARGERIIADARHTVGNRDAREAAANTERITADARHAIRNRDAREVTATPERIIADARHAVFDDYCFDAILITVPRHRRINNIILHLPRSGDRQHSRCRIKCPRYVVPLCAAGAAIGFGRRGQNEKRRQGGEDDHKGKRDQE